MHTTTLSANPGRLPTHRSRVMRLARVPRYANSRANPNARQYGAEGASPAEETRRQAEAEHRRCERQKGRAGSFACQQVCEDACSADDAYRLDKCDNSSHVFCRQYEPMAQREAKQRGSCHKKAGDGEKRKDVKRGVGSGDAGNCTAPKEEVDDGEKRGKARDKRQVCLYAGKPRRRFVPDASHAGPLPLNADMRMRQGQMIARCLRLPTCRMRARDSRAGILWVFIYRHLFGLAGALLSLGWMP